MKIVNLILLFVITTHFACDSNDEISVEERLIGDWEYSYSLKGSEQTSTFGEVMYAFKNDKTFIKYLDSFDWRDEGTWTYKEDSKTLSLIYKTYTNQISDTQSLDLKIEKLTDKELVFKVDYNKTNNFGEFVEFEFIHYLKR